MTKEYIFTSESVTEGHPDKMADQIMQFWTILLNMTKMRVLHVRQWFQMAFV
jgi:S-adenosylmethionine synthetase